MSRAKQKISIVSLGCARNLVDSEVMAGLLQQSEYVMVQQPADADVIIVNTCGFIDAAKEESIDTIIEVGRLKEEGNLKKLIVAGCLSQRYPEELARELPEVDLFIGTGEVPRVAEILREHETKVLADRGVKEINLIAQDLTAYGRERKDGTTLYGLLKQMTQIPDLEWIRLLYSYPNFLEKPLLDLILDSDKICKYLDIPFQHVSRSVLQRMRRGKSGSAVREAVQALREAIPEVTLRTSLIVGFPGESEADFASLLDFVEETQFDRLGVFKYSEEEGTAAAKLDGKVSEEDKEKRWQELMEVQAVISRKKNEALIGC